MSLFRLVWVNQQHSSHTEVQSYNEQHVFTCPAQSHFYSLSNHYTIAHQDTHSSIFSEVEVHYPPFFPESHHS